MSADRIRPGSARGGRGADNGAPDNGLDSSAVPEAPTTPPDALSDRAEGEALTAAEAGPEAVEELNEPAVLPIEKPLVEELNEPAVLPTEKPLVEELAEPLSLDVTVAAIAEDVPRPVTAPAQHGFFRRLYYGETRIDFVRRKKIWFLISGVVILAGVISMFTRGLNLGIEFVGGTSWTVPSQSLTVSQVQHAIGSTVSGETITILGSGKDRTVQVEAKLPKGQSSATSTTIANKVAGELAAVTHQSASVVSIESVGPSWGGQVTNKAIEALIVFFIMIAAYISIFFEWRMAVAAIIAVFHDVLVTVGIYSLSGFEVTPDTVVAFLTILGYSLYDTIVVFDRVRDNTRHLSVRDRLTFSDIVNVSMNQTLARSINTSLVAIMPILAVLVLGADVLGATTLQYFGLALLIGLTTGAYSSIFIASPLVAMMKEHEPRYVQLRERLTARGGERVLLSAADVARGTYLEAAPRRAGRNGRAAAATNEDGTAVVDAPRAPRPAVQPQTNRRPSSRNRPRGGRR